MRELQGLTGFASVRSIGISACPIHVGFIEPAGLMMRWPRGVAVAKAERDALLIRADIRSVVRMIAGDAAAYLSYSGTLR